MVGVESKKCPEGMAKRMCDRPHVMSEHLKKLVPSAFHHHSQQTPARGSGRRSFMYPIFRPL